ncbi:MAG: hypothetical protein ACFFDN_46975, partial [Candidatus Hodarchaeota archaeon]
MDTEYDYITPEFLHLLFFEQKNLVIFPYIDLKYLHSFELYTIGYNIIDLESTMIHNLVEIIDLTSQNSYSSTKNFYFVYNLNRKKLQDILQLSDIRCLLNSSENVSELADGDSFIFFNKKNNRFINYD